MNVSQQWAEHEQVSSNCDQKKLKASLSFTLPNADNLKVSVAGPRATSIQVKCTTLTFCAFVGLHKFHSRLFHSIFEASMRPIQDPSHVHTSKKIWQESNFYDTGAFRTILSDGLYGSFLTSRATLVSNLQVILKTVQFCQFQNDPNLL